MCGSYSLLGDQLFIPGVTWTPESDATSASGRRRRLQFLVRPQQHGDALPDELDARRRHTELLELGEVRGAHLRHGPRRVADGLGVIHKGLLRGDVVSLGNTKIRNRRQWHATNVVHPRMLGELSVMHPLTPSWTHPHPPTPPPADRSPPSTPTTLPPPVPPPTQAPTQPTNLPTTTAQAGPNLADIGPDSALDRFRPRLGQRRHGVGQLTSPPKKVDPKRIRLSSIEIRS